MEHKITATIGNGRTNSSYRVFLGKNPSGRELVWDSMDGEAREAMAYFLGAVDAYTDGSAFDRYPTLADVRESLAFRPELSEALHLGRADGEAARHSA
jgi:hypothetical protein